MKLWITINEDSDQRPIASDDEVDVATEKLRVWRGTEGNFWRPIHIADETGFVLVDESRGRS